MNSKPHLLGVLAGLFLAAGLVLSALLVSRAWLKISETQIITVTGSARKNVKSDMVVWRGSFSQERPTLAEAQRALVADLKTIETFLAENGVTNHSASTIWINEIRPRTKNGDEDASCITGYRLSQSVEVSSTDVDRIAGLDSAKLIERGILFTAGAPSFIYTKAGEAKVEMLAEATKDARARAEQICMQGGRQIHQLRSARMGVFQITPLHSIETSSEGINDTSSIEKTITAVVSTTFSLK